MKESLFYVKNGNNASEGEGEGVTQASAEKNKGASERVKHARGRGRDTPASPLVCLARLTPLPPLLTSATHATERREPSSFQISHILILLLVCWLQIDMNKQLCIRIQEAGFEVDLDPPRDGDCFYHAAAHQLGINCKAAKNRLFSFLESNRIDVSHDSILFSFCTSGIY